MRQLTFSPCFFLVQLSGWQNRFDTNEGLGCEYMAPPFTLGMRISFVYV